MAKNQANAKQHPETELFIHILHQCYHHPKVIGLILKIKQKNNMSYSWDYTINHKKMKMNMKIGFLRWNTNIPKPRYSKYKKCQKI